MTEQILIETKPKYNMNVLALITFAFFASLDFIILLIHSIADNTGTGYYYLLGEYYSYEKTWSPECIIDSIEDLWPLAIGLLIVGIVMATIVYLSKSELTVTNMRVYGRGFLGKRVDLPADSISAIAASPALLRGIVVSTSSGKISFFMIENHEMVYKTISQLLIERQDAKAKSTHSPAPAAVASAADELKKYKDLLDAGIITQEEFEIKKKQLLGL